MLDAPTGSGKTLIGEMVRQSLDVRGLYLCDSLNLQHQFQRDFPAAAILYGRSNYPTFDSPSAYPELSAGDCDKRRTTLPACSECTETTSLTTGLHCRWCHPVTSCPYEQAKATAIRSELCCTNSSYFLHEANYVGNIGIGRGLIVVDEADTLEEVVSGFVTVNVSERQQKLYGLSYPDKKTVSSAWVQWALDAQQRVSTFRQSSACRGDNIENIRNRIRTDRLYQNIRRLNDPLTGLAAGGWIYTGYDRGEIRFAPIEVSGLCKESLWRHGKRWLLMSASLISFQAVADNLGIDEYEVAS